MNAEESTFTQLEKVKELMAYYGRNDEYSLNSHEVHPQLEKGSRGNYLYFTLPACINFQRSSPAMWQSALRTYADRSTRYVFFPEKLVEHSDEEIRMSLTKHKLALQPNKHVAIWMRIAETLHNYYRDDPREIIKEVDSDAGQLIKLLQVDKRELFPYLRGPKLSNYWPYVLSHNTDVIFKNDHEISIIPDTHVQQSSVQLGVVPPGATPLQVEQAWRKLLTGSGVSPYKLHPVLWHWSRNKFFPKV